MIVVDMEASGLDPNKHSLLSIGAVEFEKPENQFYGECRLFEGAQVDPDALGINGFTEKQIVDQSRQKDEELVKAFIDWSNLCEEQTLAGQNVSTDRDFIRAAAARYHMNWTFAYRVLDLHSVAYFHHIKMGVKIPIKNKHSALNLDGISRYCGMSDEPMPHNGLTGAKLEAECFSRLFFDKELLDEYKQFKIPWLEKRVF